MFDQTITIYNQHTTGKAVTWNKTVIHNVSWAGQQRVTTGEGLTSNDGYSVRIRAKDMPGGFVLRDEYIADPEGHWTAQNGDIVALGETPDVENSITEITRLTDSFKVIAVHTANRSRLLPHLRVEGK